MTDMPDLKELIAANHKLIDLIEPLQILLALERAPGIGERLENFLAELTGIRMQMQRAADTMEQALAHNTEARAVEIRLERRLSLIQADLATLKSWLGAPPPEATPNSSGNFATPR